MSALEDDGEKGCSRIVIAFFRGRTTTRKTEWKYGIMPQIVDGKNIAAFIDTDIVAKLAALERERDARDAICNVENDLEVAGYRLLTAEEI